MMTSRPSRPVRRSGSSANAFRPSASITSGIVARSTSCRTNSRVAARLAETRTDRDDVARHVEHAIDAVGVEAVIGFRQRLGHVLRRHRRDIGWHAAGVATVTRPAPDRSAPIAERCAAPVLPREPATISTRP